MYSGCTSVIPKVNLAAWQISEDVGHQGAVVTLPYLPALVNVLGGHDIIHQTIGDQGTALSPSITLNPFSFFQITKSIVPPYLAIATKFSPSSSFQCYPCYFYSLKCGTVRKERDCLDSKLQRHAFTKAKTLSRQKHLRLCTHTTAPRVSSCSK